jgi:hypothetical protein
MPLQKHIHLFVSGIGNRIHVHHLSIRSAAKKKLSIRIGWEFGRTKSMT